MAVIPEITCRRCGSKYSGLRNRCPKCGARVYLEGEYGVSTGFLQGYNWKEFICRNCGPYKVKDDGTIF